MYDIFFFGTSKDSWHKLKSRFPQTKKAFDIFDAKNKCLTKFFYAVFDDLHVCEDFDFLYQPDDWSQNVVHVFRNGNHYDGVCLIPKNNLPTEKELEYRFFTQKKEVDTVASNPLSYDTFYIDKYEEYLNALEKTTTEFFWVIPSDVEINSDFDFSYQAATWEKHPHLFLNGDYYDGVSLHNTHSPTTKKEFEHRFFTQKKEVDIQASSPKAFDKFYIDKYEEYLNALEKTTTEFFWVIPSDVEINSDFDFSYQAAMYEKFPHVFLNGDYYDGVSLHHKLNSVTEKEFEHRFYAEKKEVDIQASKPKPYDVFDIETYEDYQYALKNSSTEMFWMSSPNIKVNQELINTFYFSHHNSQDRSQNHAFVHDVDGEKYYNGMFLCSKKQPLTKREVEYRFPVNRREWDLLGSKKIQYPRVSINTYAEYEKACETVSSELFWAIPDDVDVVDTFDFDWYFTHNNEYDRNINHSLLNGKYNDGIVLCSKNAKISKKEFDYGFVINKKEYNILASTPKSFDIVFISYNEPDADENFEKLQQSYPRAKRVHGVKGIHNAHIEAARQVDTEMFWVVDADAEIVDGFNFDYQVPRWDQDAVHVWRSRNPINDLIYGYGGIKLLPTDLTLNMDISRTDMTTSISTKFKAVEEVSNITYFNTDAFSAWKSAFRECAKLSSRIIDNQDDLETMERLAIWCNVGTNESYGIDAIRGAKEGKKFGEENKHNLEELKKINDFDWLKTQFDGKS